MQRFFSILIASSVLWIAVATVWMSIAVGSTGLITGDHTRVETIGYSGLMTTVIASTVAWLNGIVLGAITPLGQRKLLRRLLWHLLAYLLLAIAWTVFIFMSTAPAAKV